MKRQIVDFLKRTAAAAMAASVLVTAIPVHGAGTNNTSRTAASNNTSQTSATGSSDTAGESETDASEDNTNGDYIMKAIDKRTVNGEDRYTLEALAPDKFTSNYNAGVAAGDHLYTLTISTGIKAGTKAVSYIAVRYTDTDGQKQSEYILMTDDPLKQSYDYISKKGGTNKELKDRHDKLSSLNYSVKDPEDPKALEAWSTEEYLFETEKDIKSVDDIHILMRGGTSWSVQGIAVSKVVKVGGYGEYGFYSGKYFFGLTKKPICRMVSKKSGTITLSPPSGADQRYKLCSGTSPYFGMEQVTDAAEGTSPFRDLYTIRMDFADTLEGGIESYLTAIGRDDKDIKRVPSGFNEQVVLEIEYRDKNKWTRHVTIPVMLSAYGQYLCSSDNVYTIGLGQRGETVAFTGYFPEFEKLLNTTIYVGSKARAKLSEEGKLTPKTNALESALNKDKIVLSGLSIYKGTCRISNTPDGTAVIPAGSKGISGKSGDTLKSYTTAYSFSSAAPDYYYTKTGGETMSASFKAKLPMDSYKATDPLLGYKMSENILVRVMTDGTSELTGTLGDVKMRINYVDIYGKSRTSRFFNLKTEANNFTGYWPSGSGNAATFPYNFGMVAGNYVEFMAELPDIAGVLDIDIALSETNDEYVLGGVGIYSVSGMGRRRIYRKNLDGYGDSSGVWIVRSAAEEGAINGFPFALTQPRIISGGESYNYKIGAVDGSDVITSVETDEYANMRYSMTHEQAMRDLGFAKSRKTFEVGVKVADDSDVMDENGDSGSENQFYFQLTFQNGNSGFVLANQQMQSDRFRAGFTEVFDISVNHNYGALKTVQIIPEDITSDSDVFDKLNIESITVTEDTGGGAATQYVIENVGWIGIDYHDEAEAVSIRGQAGRTIGDLSSRFSVSYKRKVVGLLCEISTLPGADQIQPEASVACEVSYIDINDEPQTFSFDVISRMASYMKKKPKSYEGSTSGTDAIFYRNMTTISDPQWMLRASHMDRFIMPSIANLKSIKSMTLVAVNRGEGTAEWVIGGVSLAEITADGPLTLTADNEYYRAMHTIPLCRNESVRDTEVMTLTAGTAQSLTLNFSENQITYTEDQDTWATPVSRLPDSGADKLNIYVFPDEKSRNISGKTITLTAQYSTSFSGAKQISDKVFTTYGSGTSDAMFYTQGLAVDGMQRLMSLGLRCVNDKTYFDYAIVQQVREEVIVASYYIPFMGASATLGLSVSPTSSDKMVENKLQKLSVGFGMDTAESTLFEMNNDIAVAFKYRCSLDTKENKTGKQYWSPYVYLTDVGYTSIRRGMVAEITYELPFVAEITGYRIVQFGSIVADVEGAQIACYSYDKKSVDSTGAQVLENQVKDAVYSFNQAKLLENKVREYAVTSKGVSSEGTLANGCEGKGAVNLVDLTFKTKDVSESHESGTNEPVEMVFYYINNKGALQYKQIDDATRYIQDEEQVFATSESANMKLFLPDCQDMVAILIIPYDFKADRIATWSIDKVEGFMSLGDKPLNRAVNMQFTEDTKHQIVFIEGYDLPDESKVGKGILTSSNNMGETIYDYGIPDGRRFEGTVLDHHATLELYPGENINFYPGFEGGGSYTARAMVLTTYTGGAGQAERAGYVNFNSGFHNENGIVTLTPRLSDEEQTYKVIITSTYNSSLKDIIDITVLSSGRRPGSTPLTLKTTYDYGKVDGDRKTGTVSDHKASLTLKEDETINFKCEVTGDDESSFDVKATYKTGDASGDAGSAISDLSGSGFTFTPLTTIESDEDIVYTININTPDPDACDVITVTVKDDRVLTVVHKIGSGKDQTVKTEIGKSASKSIKLARDGKMTFTPSVTKGKFTVSATRKNGSSWVEATDVFSGDGSVWTFNPDNTGFTDVEYRIDIKTDNPNVYVRYNITVGHKVRAISVKHVIYSRYENTGYYKDERQIETISNSDTYKRVDIRLYDGESIELTPELSDGEEYEIKTYTEIDGERFNIEFATALSDNGTTVTFDNVWENGSIYVVAFRVKGAPGDNIAYYFSCDSGERESLVDVLRMHDKESDITPKIWLGIKTRQSHKWDPETTSLSLSISDKYRDDCKLEVCKETSGSWDWLISRPDKSYDIKPEKGCNYHAYFYYKKELIFEFIWTSPE